MAVDETELPADGEVETTAPVVEQEMAEAAPASEQPIAQTVVEDTTASQDETDNDSVASAIDPLPLEIPEARNACEIAFASTTVELVRFIKLQDFVPCDFNEDGIVDILAFNHRISTGYGFQGIGNGLFEEGPSFDLPFRPIACAAIGDPRANNIILLSKEGSLSVFHPLVSTDPPTGFIDVPLSIRPLGDEFATRFAVIDEANLLAGVYELIGSGVLKLGDYSVERAENMTNWFGAILDWETDCENMPGLPLTTSAEMRIADFNCDGISDLVSAHNHELIILLSAENTPLALERRCALTGRPLSIRLADIDGNGLPDILLLHESGVLEAIIVEVIE